MTEAMLQGLSFAGQDINPLAILACSVKKGPFQIQLLKNESELLRTRLLSDTKDKIDINFKGRDKWFSLDVSIALSKIRRAIIKTKSKRIRRFLGLAMAETIRNTRNSRMTTFKLHIRTTDDIANRKIDSIAYFLREIAEVLQERDLLRGTFCRQSVGIKCKDTLRGGFYREKGKFELLVTSPPYGDNGTTVPYGQYSFLPLQWIDRKDISVKLKSDYLRTAQEIDRRSLGAVIEISNVF